MTRFWPITLTFLGLLLPISLQAAPLHVVVELQNLTVVQSPQKGGNQIYVNLLESCMDKAGKSQICAASAPQLHWQFLKKDLTKHVWLWQGKLDEGETAQIDFIVHEKGFKPFKPEESVGSMTLKLKNAGGKLQSTWTNGKETTSTKISPVSNKFRLADNSGVYGIYEMLITVELT